MLTDNSRSCPGNARLISLKIPCTGDPWVYFGCGYNVMVMTLKILVEMLRNFPMMLLHYKTKVESRSVDASNRT